MTCHAHMSNFWLRGYAARLRGEPIRNSCIFQGQPRMDWESGHKSADKEIV